MFDNDDIAEIKRIANEITKDNSATIKDFAIKNWLEDHPNKTHDLYKRLYPPKDIMATAWANALLLVLKMKGYKVSK